MDTFRIETSLNAILYVLNKMGGQCDIHKICKLLYFADQKHLSLYGRAITGDDYLKKTYGPVPSKIYEILSAVRGDSFFSEYATQYRLMFKFVNNYIIQALQKPNSDYLSESDIECLDYSIQKYAHLNFNELTSISHGLAWNNTNMERKISVKDILREIGDTEEYVAYVDEMLKLCNCEIA